MVEGRGAPSPVRCIEEEKRPLGMKTFCVSESNGSLPARSASWIGTKPRLISAAVRYED